MILDEAIKKQQFNLTAEGTFRFSGSPTFEYRWDPLTESSLHEIAKKVLSDDEFVKWKEGEEIKQQRREHLASVQTVSLETNREE